MVSITAWTPSVSKKKIYISRGTEEKSILFKKYGLFKGLDAYLPWVFQGSAC